MIRLLKLLVVLAILWSLYWAGAGWVLRQGISGWFDLRAAEGWRAEFASISTAGYPLRHMTRLEAPALADPETGAAWQADWLSFESPATWPGDQTLRFAETPQRLSYFDDTLTLEAFEMIAGLKLVAGLSLTLEEMALTSESWRIAREQETVMAAEAVTLSMVRQEEDPALYRFDIAAPAFSPGDGLRRMIGSSSDLPRTFETLTIDASIQFDRAWDRRALEERRPQPREIDLRLAEARWGALALSAAGELAVDEAGIPEGEITVRAENWREMLRMAQASGALPQTVAEQAERVLGFIARLGSNPEALDVQLNLRDGYVLLGPVLLGPAPRLIIH